MQAKERCKATIDEKEALVRKQKQDALMDCATGVACRRPSKLARQAGMLGFLTEGKSKQQEANEALARGFYAAGLPPNVLDNPYFIDGLRKVALVDPSYDPPDRKELVGKMLDEEKERVSSSLNSRRVVVAANTGTTVVSDGATVGNNVPIINLLEVAAGYVAFVDSKDCTGKVKDAQYIADYICTFIEAQADPESVAQVLMDNATRASWKLIEERCPWVAVGSCLPHVGSLEVGDIVRLPRCAQLVKKATALRKFVTNHQHVLAAFKDVSDRMLVKPGVTRMHAWPPLPFY